MEPRLFEALTAAGIAPDAACQVERSIEAAIRAGQQVVRARLHEQLMTKADGMSLQAALKADNASLKAELKAGNASLKAELKADLAGFRGDFYKALNEQTWKVTGSVVVANALLVVLFKCLP